MGFWVKLQFRNKVQSRLLFTGRNGRVIVLSFLLLLTACGPSQNGPTAAANPPKDELIYQAPAQPTVTFDDAKTPGYQAPPSEVHNQLNQAVTDGHLMVDAKADYNSEQKRLVLSGVAKIYSEAKDQMALKQFVLIGVQQPDAQIIELFDDNEVAGADVIIRARATCMGIGAQEKTDCSHILIDIYARHKGVVYRQQVETYTNAKGANAQKNPAEPPLLKPIPPSAPSTDPDEDAKKDQSDLQAEDGDQSLDGAYQGTFDTTDLDLLYSQPNPIKNPPPVTPAPQPEPAAPTPVAPPSVPVPVTPAAPTPVPHTSAPQQTPNPQPPIQQPVPSSPVPLPSPVQNPQPQQIAPTPVPMPAPLISSPNPAQVFPEMIMKDKLLGNEIVQTPEGVVRPINQAVGFPEAGSLRHSTSLVERQKTLGSKAFFEVVAPDRKKHFATFEMSELLIRMGNFLNETYTKKAYVGNSSLVNGGKVSPHVSHQIGIDADLGYPTMLPGIKFPLVVRMTPRAFFTNNYSTEKTFNLFKYIFTQKDVVVDRVFADQSIINELCAYAKKHGETTGPEKAVVQNMFQNMQHVTGHGDHFHVRIKCSKRDVGCRLRIYRKMPSC